MDKKYGYKTEINIEFVVYTDDFDSSALYTLVGIEEAYFYKKGDQIESQTSI